ncbi:MAG: flavin reductase family protein [Thermoprotei archaeon]|nr:MAG: flavin reductase family protein [Thermoprotei archaeon]RLF22602.1 MAG: flavin reductase family protein [Thermoprotei archaeon]
MEKVEVKDRISLLLHPRNTVIVTCCTVDGKPNAITLSWFMPLSFKPPMVAIAVSPRRYSHKLIADVGEFVVNVPSMNLFRQMWICGTKSGRSTDKIKECGFTLEKSIRVRPPSIRECIANLECRVVKTIETGDHTTFIGEVVAARVVKGLFDGVFDTKKVKHILHVGYDVFTTTSDEVLRATT